MMRPSLAAGEDMNRHTRSGSLVIIAGVASWLASPAHAQPAKVEAGKESVSKNAVAAAAATVPKISILRLQVIKPDPTGGNMRIGMARRRAFGLPDTAPEGTSLTFLVEDPEQWIFSLESKNSKILDFHDDKNTDLNVSKPEPEPQPQGQGRPNPFNRQAGPEECTLSSELDPAGHHAIVTVHSPQFPATGANGLRLEAELVMKYARGSKTVEQKNVNLKFDTITVGPVPLVVMTQVDDNGGMVQRDGMQVTIIHQGQLREITKVAFIGADGEEIQTNGTGSGQNGSIHTASYHLVKRVETCTIRLTVPDKIETVTLAVTINTGLGFPPGVRRRIVTPPESSAKAPR
jgi:hypothetical protein